MLPAPFFITKRLACRDTFNNTGILFQTHSPLVKTNNNNNNNNLKRELLVHTSISIGYNTTLHMTMTAVIIIIIMYNNIVSIIYNTILYDEIN